MASFSILCGLILGALISPLYVFMMRRLGSWQRIYIFFLIGSAMIALSAQWDQMQPGNLRAFFFSALTLGWFACGLFHAVISLCRGWGRRQPPQATPEPVQD